MAMGRYLLFFQQHPKLSKGGGGVPPPSIQTLNDTVSGFMEGDNNILHTI